MEKERERREERKRKRDILKFLYQAKLHAMKIEDIALKTKHFVFRQNNYLGIKTFFLSKLFIYFMPV